MCLVVVGVCVAADAPLVIGANREEFYERGGTVPQLVNSSCRFVAGLDPVAGGTWLGINENGVVIAVANRAKSRQPSQPRSRGLLVRDLLGCADVTVATELAQRELASERYAGCNLLCAGSSGAVVFHAGDTLEVRHLQPGWHAFSARNTDDTNDVRIFFSLRFLEKKQPADVPSSVEAMKKLCSHTRDAEICLHGHDRGTVSSSIITVGEPRRTSVYWHCQGSPDREPYTDYSRLLREFWPT